MIDPIKILQRAWYILWSYRTLWVFGLILALATGSASMNRGNNSNWRYNDEGNGPQPPRSENMPQSWDEFTQQMRDALREGIPHLGISGEELTAFLWTLGGFVVFMLLVSILISIAYYVSVTAVIRMVDEYENTATKMSFREGWRIGWSRTAWRVFLINLIVHLPILLFLLIALITGVSIFLSAINDNLAFTPPSIVALIALLFLGIFTVVILSVVLSLLRPFWWRIAVLENAGVRESLRRGFAMARENWKSAGLMWLVMIGLGIVWIPVFLIAAIITLPVLVLTIGIALLVSAIPALLLYGIFSLFLGGWLPWIAAALFVLPLFFLIAFSPWLLLGNWQSVFTSTAWTLAYREIKALPALAPPAEVVPVGD